MNQQNMEWRASAASAEGVNRPAASLDEDDLALSVRPRRLPWWLFVLLAIVIIAIGGVVGYLVMGRPFSAPGNEQQAEAVVLSPAAAEQPAAVTSEPAAPVPEPVAAASDPAAPAGPAATPADAVNPGLGKVATFGDWVLACPMGTDRGTTCLLQQQLKSKESNATLFLWVMRRDPDGSVHAVWLMPKDVNPQSGLTMDIGDGKPRKVPFRGCNNRACTVEAVIAPEYLQSLQQAEKVTATIVAANGRPGTLALSARGMADGLARLAASP